MANEYYVKEIGYKAFSPVNASLDFSYPYWNGIRVVSSEMTASLVSFPWYGDTMTIRMWGMLHLNTGTLASGVNVLTRQDGYQYIYNTSTKVFEVYDETKTLKSRTTNITSIADMKIDFTIANSHQFKVIYGGNDDSTKYFIIGHFEKPAYDMVIDDDSKEGVGNIYLADLARPYDKDDINNPTYFIKLLATYDTIINKAGTTGTTGTTVYEYFGEWSRLHVANGGYYQYTGLNKYPTLLFNKVLSNTYFYLKGFEWLRAVHVKVDPTHIDPHDPKVDPTHIDPYDPKVDPTHIDPYDPKGENCSGTFVTIDDDGGVKWIAIIAPKGQNKKDIKKYQANKEYKQCSFVEYNYEYYRCITPYTSTGDFESEINNWIKVDSKINSDYICGDCESCHDGINTDYYLTYNDNIYEVEVGREYKKDEVLTYVNEDGFRTNYLVLQDFTLTDLGIDSKYLNKICDVLIKNKQYPKLIAKPLSLTWLLSEYSTSLYPALEPLQRPDVGINNRPVYEPWLIYGKYKFVIAGHGEHWNDDITISLYDLSPSW